MKYTEAIEEIEGLIGEYENDISNGYIGDSPLWFEDAEWRRKAIVNMACAINRLKDCED